ncbi:MAG: tRNA epoxyqueuosine(34) reductase QueG [Prevotellaceae bacterium]|nr:tRNA epoxyqueuosine(34) reductase QueG [Prevotellaceae bacterium]
MELSGKIKAEAYRLGFSACGIARVMPLENDTEKLDKWLNSNYNGEMKYMENHFDMRLNPALLVEGAKSVISLAYNYYSSKKQVEDAPVISKYAYGVDYHVVIRKKLNLLLDFVRHEQEGVEGKGFVDSAPILEKSWAQQSGIGWRGKNGTVIITGKGSFHFLAELILNIELDYDNPATSKCGACVRCIESCPTGAIVEPYVVDARKCIAYLTIELKSKIPDSFKGKFAGRVFGCDICQDVCPWNIRYATENSEPRFAPSQSLLDKTKEDWNILNEEEFRSLFRESAVKRTKFAGLKQNLLFLQNYDQTKLVCEKYKAGSFLKIK